MHLEQENDSANVDEILTTFENFVYNNFLFNLLLNKI